MRSTVEAGGASPDNARRSGPVGTRINGWNFPPRSFGRAGLADDFLLRAAVQCLGGIISNDPEEAVYANTFLDGSGQPLDRAKRYTMHFGPGQLPDVRAFWSMTLYGDGLQLRGQPDQPVRDR